MIGKKKISELQVFRVVGGFKMQPTHDQAIDHSAAIVIPPEETFLGGFAVIFVNPWDCEQERLLLVSSLAFYRVKYDMWSPPTEESVLRAHRFPLEEIRLVQRGRFVRSAGLLGWMRGESDESPPYGFRVFAGDGKSVSPFAGAEQSYFQTFRPFHPDQSQRQVMEIIDMLQQARQELTNPFLVDEFELIRPSTLGIVSAVHDAFKFGLWTR